MKYFFEKTLKLPYETVKTRLIETLKKEGFGVLTEIDVQATLKNKLNVDFYRYEILGACNPKMAHQALQAEDKIGTMLPCNIILQQKSLNGPVEVSAADPVVMMKAVGNPALDSIARQVQKLLLNAIEQL